MLKIPIGDLFYAQSGTIDTYDFKAPSLDDPEIEVVEDQDIEFTGIKIEDGVCFYPSSEGLEVKYQCTKCLEPSQARVTFMPIEKHFYMTLPEDMDDDLAQKIDSKSFEVDLFELYREAVFLSLPFVLLCKPDCKGICPICKQNRNVKACKCAPAQADDGHLNQTNPFQNLKDLIKKQK